MREVMSNNEVAQAWASQSQYTGRNGKKSLYFEGPILYSYGRHYIVAALHQNNVATINSIKSSHTTETHKSLAASAVEKEGRRTLYVPITIPVSNGDHVINLEDYRKRIEDEAGKFFRSRKYKRTHLGRIKWFVEEVRFYCSYFDSWEEFKIAFVGLEDLVALSNRDLTVEGMEELLKKAGVKK